MVTLQSRKTCFFYGHQLFFKNFFFKYMPFGSMNMLFILQILHFYFFCFWFYFFALSAQFSCGFWALAHSSFNIFQKLLKRGSMRFFWGMTLVCMQRKKFGHQGPFPPKRKKNTILFFILGRSSLILSKFGPKIKKSVFLRSTQKRKFDRNFSHINYFTIFSKCWF